MDRQPPRQPPQLTLFRSSDTPIPTPVIGAENSPKISTKNSPPKSSCSPSATKDRGFLPPYKCITDIFGGGQLNLFDNTVTLGDYVLSDVGCFIGYLKLSKKQKNIFSNLVDSLSKEFRIRNRAKAKLVMFDVLACLVAGRDCIVSLNKNQRNYDLNVQVYRTLCDYNVCYLFKQPKGEHGASSVLSASGKFIKAVNKLRLPAASRIGKANISIHRSTEIARIGKNKKRTLLDVEPVLERANDAIVYPHYELTAKHAPNVLREGKRVFMPALLTRKYVDDDGHGGRFYAGVQNVPKAIRRTLKFNQSEAVELDFKAIHIGLMYASIGQQVKHGTEYEMSEYPRSFVKNALLRLVNSSSERRFIQVLERSVNPDFIARYERLREYKKRQRSNWTGKGKRPTVPEPFKPVTDTPADINARQFLKALKLKHRPIKHLFCSDRLGTALQYHDSEIMALVLTELTELGIPSIPIHDSVIVPKRSEKKARDVMRYAYQLSTGGYASVVDIEK